MERDKCSGRGWVGVIPAAGKAKRLGLPGTSKELLPLLEVPACGGPRVRAACDLLVERLLAAPVEELLMVIDPDKSDLFRHLGGQRLPVPFAFVPRPNSPSLVHSLAAALPFVGERHVLLGFPDLLFEPRDTLTRLRAELEQESADLVLALFPAADCRTTDMVGFDPDRRVTKIEVRPETSEQRLAWALAAWGPKVSALLAVSLDSVDGQGERQLGTVFQRALDAGLKVRAVPLETGRFLDLGTAEGLLRLQQERSWLAVPPSEHEM